MATGCALPSFLQAAWLRRAFCISECLIFYADFNCSAGCIVTIYFTVTVQLPGSGSCFDDAATLPCGNEFTLLFDISMNPMFETCFLDVPRLPITSYRFGGHRCAGCVACLGCVCMRGRCSLCQACTLSAYPTPPGLPGDLTTCRRTGR